MHITVCLKPDQPLALPIHYNYLVQASIYHSISPELASFLHENGFSEEKRVFRLFSFSLLQGPFVIDKSSHTIVFNDFVQFTLSSPLEPFCQSIANILLNRGHMQLGKTEVPVKKVDVCQYKVKDEEIVVQTQSPIVLYSTFLRPDGRKYTCYFQPGEPDYESLMAGNLRKKYKAFYGIEPPGGQISVRAKGPQKMHLVNYKGTIIKGHSGQLRLNGPVPLLQLGVDSGLGGKNAQGFGCVVMLNKR